MLDDDLCASLQWTKALAQEDNHWSSNCRTAERSTSHVGNKRRTKYDCGVRRGQLFTPIKLSYSRLLDLIQSTEGFAWPQPMHSDPSQWDKTRFYNFHIEHGHFIDECRHLKHLVENTIHVGKLAQYVKASRPEWESGPSLVITLVQIDIWLVISVIFRGSLKERQKQQNYVGCIVPHPIIANI